MMTGEELHGLFLRVGVPKWEPWNPWDDTTPRMRQTFDAVAEILNERQAEDLFAVTAGEDI